MKHTKKGFTLIELLVVIAIIAILSVVVILTLNPAELLRQARDSNRISDLSTLKSALSLYLADVSSTVLGTYTSCYSTLSGNTSTTANCNTVFGVDPTLQASTTATLNPKVDGTGWIPVDFSDISSGSPIGSLPVDPTNVGDNVYFYRASSTTTTFKLAGKMESSKYNTGGSGDVQTNDGGNSTGFYEVGTNLTM